MDIQREKEFVSQYHYDARNFEWEKENGIPETKSRCKLSIDQS